MTQSNDVDDESFPCNKSESREEIEIRIKSDEPIDSTPLATKSAHSGSVEIESEYEEGDDDDDDDDKESFNEIKKTE
jgi:hypothetical protein